MPQDISCSRQRAPRSVVITFAPTAGTKAHRTAKYVKIFAANALAPTTQVFVPNAKLATF